MRKYLLSGVDRISHGLVLILQNPHIIQQPWIRFVCKIFHCSPNNGSRADSNNDPFYILSIIFIHYFELRRYRNLFLRRFFHFNKGRSFYCKGRNYFLGCFISKSRIKEFRVYLHCHNLLYTMSREYHLQVSPIIVRVAGPRITKYGRIGTRNICVSVDRECCEKMSYGNEKVAIMTIDQDNSCVCCVRDG